MTPPKADLIELARVRDNFFYDTRVTGMDDFNTANAIMVNGIADPSSLLGLDRENLTALQLAAAELADDYTGLGGARVFDHYSTAQIHPANHLLTALGHLCAAIFNNNTILADVSPRGVAYEKSGVDWMLRNIAGYDPAVGSGVLTSGGTLANQTALFVARLKTEKDGWEADEPVKVLTTRMAHYSVKKALKLLAPAGKIQVEPVALERGGFRMDPASLEEQVQATIASGTRIMSIVAVAGETETGLVDNIEAIAEIANKHGIYLHVDGAYGGPFRMSRASAAFEAVSQSSSLTTDPHKCLWLPYGCGTIMFRDIDDHMMVSELNEDGERYLHTNGHENHDPDALAAVEIARDHFRNASYRGQTRIEGSLGDHAAVALALVIRYIGITGFRALLDHTLDVTQAFSREFNQNGCDSLVPAHIAQLNTLCLLPSTDVRYAKGADARVKELARRMEKEHKMYVSTTGLPDPDDEQRREVTALRFVATNPHTTEDIALEIAGKIKDIWADTRVA